MHIGMFCDMYMPHVSGVTNHIRLYSAALQQLGHEVTVFTYGDRSEADNGCRVVRSPALPWGDTGWNFPLGLSSEATSAMSTLDVAHAHHPFASCLTPLKHCAPRGVPVVFTNHTRYDLYAETYVSWIPVRLRQGAITRYLTHLNSRVSMTICPSAELVSWLAGYGVNREKLTVFPNGIDTRPFQQPNTRRSKSDFGLSDEDFLLCYVGRVAHEKNVTLLLDAFTSAVGRNPRLSLLVVGDGPTRAESERMISERGLAGRVVFTGLMPYEDVPGVLAAADAFVSASVSEVYPLVVVEACAAGLPVIGVRSPGVGEIVSTGDSGLLTAENTESLSAAMVSLSTDARLHARLREGALDVAVAHEITASAGRLADLYARLVDSADLNSTGASR
ncbi:MAG TPA: glycosyltransferase [Coriobacteriia bacterium]|nr:glycosyltransferase [Coriobacteriia bacterium]